MIIIEKTNYNKGDFDHIINETIFCIYNKKDKVYVYETFRFKENKLTEESNFFNQDFDKSNIKTIDSILKYARKGEFEILHNLHKKYAGSGGNIKVTILNKDLDILKGVSFKEFFILAELHL